MTSTNQLAETMNSAARVGALILAIVAFAAIWETDAKRRDDWIALQNRSSSPIVMAAHVSLPESEGAVVSQTQITDSAIVLEASHPVKAESIQQLAQRIEPAKPVVRNVSSSNTGGSVWSNLKLPAEIAPGAYRVVDSRGRIDLIRLGAGTAGNGPKMYSFESDGVTTYFIRIDEPAADIEASVDPDQTQRG